MLNQKNQVSVMVGTIVLALLALSVFAQTQAPPPQYKVGDRVEVDVITQSNPANAKWQKGTVVKVDLSAVCYVIQLDPLPGQLPKSMTLPIRDYAAKWIRAGGGATPQIQTDRLRVDDNGTVLADRDVLDCKNLKQPSARNGQPLPTELAKNLIRCLYEKPSAPGSDGATTMDVIEFKPGAPHRWVKNVDSGAGGTPDTLVYPVRVKWSQKTFYRTYNQLQTDNERVFTCYVDVDKWYCGSAQFIKDGDKKQIQVK